jgi:hypothetical protein
VPRRTVRRGRGGYNENTRVSAGFGGSVPPLPRNPSFSKSTGREMATRPQSLSLLHILCHWMGGTGRYAGTSPAPPGFFCTPWYPQSPMGLERCSGPQEVRAVFAIGRRSVRLLRRSASFRWPESLLAPLIDQGLLHSLLKQADSLVELPIGHL